MNKKKVHIITGATASGKSQYALKYARDKGGEIINADSMQVYKAFPVLSAQPDVQDQAMVPHHLYGFLDIQDDFNVNKWAALAVEKIQQCWDRGALPILVGGTGFYIKALMDGLSCIPSIPASVRAAIQVRLQENSVQEMHRCLKQVDPALAERLPPQDTQRICRGLEVYEHTGKPLSYWQTLPKQKVIDSEFKVIEIRKPKAALYKGIDRRVLKMMESGALDEVKAVYQTFPDIVHPGQKTLGYPELVRFLTGKWQYDHAIEKLQQHSRNYAKRQLTWIRHQLTADVVIGKGN